MKEWLRGIVERHHCIPRSRRYEFPKLDLSEDWNIRKIPYELHVSWHWMFQNLTPWEAQDRLLIEWSQLKDTAAYIEVFGEMNEEEAIAEIERNWFPKNQVRTS